MKLLKKIVAMLLALVTTITLGYIRQGDVIATEGGIAEETAQIVWASCRSDEIRMTLPSEYISYNCGMEPWEFSYISSVIQAESNGSRDYSDFEDKVLIAAVILNRVRSGQFPNSISGVLDQSGQFTTTSNGWCSTSSSESSRWAVVIAERRLLSGEIPDNLLYFNCIGYAPGFEPYCHEGGNYFSLG